MSKLKVFIHPLSQPSRAVMMFVRANSIPHEEVFVDLAKGDQFQEEFAKNVNPLKKVPVINHDGFLLTESVAILRYLSRTFPVPDHWFPKDTKTQARVDEYMEWQHLNIRTHGSLFIMEKYMVPRKTKKPVNEAKAAIHLKGFKTCLEQMENIWLKDRPFIAGEKISIADLLAAAEIDETAIGGYDAKDHHEKIREYLERVGSAIHPHYDEANAMLNKLAMKVKAEQ